MSYPQSISATLTTGAAPSHEHFARVHLVLRDRIRDHVRDSLGIAPTSVCKGRLAGDIPTRSTVRATRPNGDVPLTIGAAVPGDEAVLEVRLG